MFAFVVVVVGGVGGGGEFNPHVNVFVVDAFIFLYNYVYLVQLYPRIQA